MSHSLTVRHALLLQFLIFSVVEEDGTSIFELREITFSVKLNFGGFPTEHFDGLNLNYKSKTLLAGLHSVSSVTKAIA